MYIVDLQCMYVHVAMYVHVPVHVHHKYTGSGMYEHVYLYRKQMP